MSEEWMCPNCGVVLLNTAGKCERCDSDQVVPLLAGSETAETSTRS